MCGRAERCDEEGVSIDTICTHSLSPSIVPISSASLSLHSTLRAAVLVVAHLQLHLQLHHAQQPRSPTIPVWSQSLLVSA